MLACSPRSPYTASGPRGRHARQRRLSRCRSHRALIKDGWTITHDPFYVPVDERRLSIDLAAERFLAAERSNRRIAVEIKSFLGNSLLEELERALGQFVLYREVLSHADPDREMLLALPVDVAVIFNETLGRMLVEANLVRGFIFDPAAEAIVQWIP